MSKNDPHAAWLNELRRKSVRISSGLADDQPGTVPGLQEQITELQDKIIATKPSGKDGVLAQVALLKELAWSDVVRRLVGEIEINIQRLWR